ncbi:hypothetical protein BVRB_8g194100 [Beta vulgaris subsp. vulgaris]|nr:hypothetical protein BVRB_8g194100 [Beta vulgaris subsp. vulgaris]
MFIVAAVIIMVMKGITAETINVGDANRWINPPSPELYTSWAAEHTFAVGDVLVFQFTTNFHTVAMVTEAGYDACDAGNAVIHTEGPTEITLNRPGEFFFICTVGTHCDNGQKFAINVTGTAAAAAPVPTSLPVEPTPTDAGSSPPMPLISTFFSVSFVAFIVALLY